MNRERLIKLRDTMISMTEVIKNEGKGQTQQELEDHLAFIKSLNEEIDGESNN